MNKTVTAALIAALAIIPSAAFAENAMHDDHMMAKPASATMICRTAASGEKGNAMMVAEHGTLVCKSVGAMMHDGKIIGPDLTKTLTVEQASAAWQAWIAAQFAVPAIPGGG